MTLSEYKAKQQALLDEIPSEESKNIIICEDCGEFVFFGPVTGEGECQGCGTTYTMKTRQRF